jgi:hypothetical protein
MVSVPRRQPGGWTARGRRARLHGIAPPARYRPMTFGPDPRWCARLAQDRARALRPPEPPAPDRVDFDPAYDPDAPIECEVCGGVMRYIAACKILCPNCGYRRDCSDP